MKIIGEYSGVMYDAEGNKILMLKVANGAHKKMVNDIEEGVPLSVEINKVKSRRSIEQNKMLWSLLSEIDKAVNGSRSNDEWSFYLQALERAGAKCEYVACREAAEDMLKKAFRAVKFVKVYDAEKKVNEYKCYDGSSKMTTAEMTELIETVLDMAAEAGVETSYWKEVLK